MPNKQHAHALRASAVIECLGEGGTLSLEGRGAAGGQVGLVVIYSTRQDITHFKVNFLPVWLHPSVMPLTEWKA